VSARLFLCGCAAAAPFLSNLPFHQQHSAALSSSSSRLSPLAAGQLLLLLLLSRLMLLRPAAAAATQLLLTHCHLAAEKQLEQSEAETQRSHSSELAKVSS
jgi:hypothetical protein